MMKRTISWRKLKGAGGTAEGESEDVSSAATTTNENKNEAHNISPDTSSNNSSINSTSTSTTVATTTTTDSLHLDKQQPQQHDRPSPSAYAASAASSGGSSSGLSTPAGTPHASPRGGANMNEEGEENERRERQSSLDSSSCPHASRQSQHQHHHHHQQQQQQPGTISSNSSVASIQSNNSSIGSGGSIGRSNSRRPESLSGGLSMTKEEAAALRTALLKEKLAAVQNKVVMASNPASSPRAGNQNSVGIISTTGVSDSSIGTSGGGLADKKRAAIQSIKNTILFGGKKQLLSKPDREQLEAKWGLDRVNKVEEEALQLFSALDGSAFADGTLKESDFQLCLGAMGGGCVTSQFPQVLFHAIDKDRSGTITFAEFLTWLLTVSHGTDEEKLRYGFDLCDQNKDGKIDKSDLTITLQRKFQILTGLNLQSDDVCVHRFVNTVFTRLGQAEEEAISWETFKKGAQSIATFLRTLGSRDVSCYHTPCARSRNQAATVVFGSPKWRFITNMMLGLEFAIRGTQEQKIELVTPSPSPRNTLPKAQVEVTTPTAAASYAYINSHSIGSSSNYTLSPAAGAHLTNINAQTLPVTTNIGASSSGGSNPPLHRQDSDISSLSGSTSGHGNGGTIGASGGGGSSSLRGVPPYLERLKSELKARVCTKEVFKIPTSDGSKCRIATYGTDQFRDIRHACGIEEDDFLLSVGIRQVIGSLLLGDLFGLSEQVSEGKSGSFFYWSQDGRYMVKTISRAESYQMRKILPSYHDHMTAHPSNLLMRILGLFRLRLNNEKWDLIIIENIFNTSHGIHERFDLKGSTYERTVGPRHRCQPGVVMKDKDFLELGRKIHVGPKFAEKLKLQIKVDSQFLAKNDIIDYSFLVGVHYVDRGIPEDVWVAQQRDELEKMFADFQEVHVAYPFFKKEFGFEDFAHYAYNHHHFDKEDSLSLLAGDGGGWSRRKGGKRGKGFTDEDGGEEEEEAFNPRQGIRAYRTVEHQLDGEPDHLLFMGVIDILVPFDGKKKGEYVLKSVYHKGKQDFSVIPPKDYRERFVQFVLNAIV